MTSALSQLLFLSLTLLTPLFSQQQSPYAPIIIEETPIKLNEAFTFRIFNYPGSIKVVRKDNGIFFCGNVSSVWLKGGDEVYEYSADCFTFSYPPQHKVTKLAEEVIQMQISYSLRQGKSQAWKHNGLTMSVSFLATDYAPDKEFTFTRITTAQPQEEVQVDFGRLLPLVSGLKTLIYKGVHSQQPENKAYLWLVRTELLLMNRQELNNIRQFIQQGSQTEQKVHHGLLKRLSDLNQIEESKPDSVEARKRQEL